MAFGTLGPDRPTGRVVDGRKKGRKNGAGGKPDGTQNGAGGKPDGTQNGAGGKPDGTQNGAGGRPDGTQKGVGGKLSADGTENRTAREPTKEREV